MGIGEYTTFLVPTKRNGKRRDNSNVCVVMGGGPGSHHITQLHSAKNVRRTSIQFLTEMDGISPFFRVPEKMEMIGVLHALHSIVGYPIAFSPRATKFNTNRPSETITAFCSFFLMLQFGCERRGKVTKKNG
jgi:hypothetical protein